MPSIRFCAAPFAHHSFIDNTKTWFCLGGGYDPGVIHVYIQDKAGVVDAKVKLEGLKHRSAVRCLTFSENGERLYSGSDDRTIKIWKTSKYVESETWNLQKTLVGHTKSVMSLSESTDGYYLTSSSGHTFRVWDVKLGVTIRVIEEVVIGVNFLDGGKILSTTKKSVTLWNLASKGKEPKRLREHSDWVNTLAISKDGETLVSGSDDENIRVWDALTGELLMLLEGHTAYVYDVAVSSDGMLIVSCSRDESVRTWNIAYGELKEETQKFEVSGSESRSDDLRRRDLGTPIGSVDTPFGKVSDTNSNTVSNAIAAFCATRFTCRSLVTTSLLSPWPQMTARSSLEEVRTKKALSNSTTYRQKMEKTTHPLS